MRYNTCVICGKQFKRPTFRPNQPCCSRECGYIYRRTHEEKECVVCGKVFYNPRHIKCCSKSCADIWNGRNKTKHICKICGKEFYWSPSRTASGKYNVTYCSLACRDADPERRVQLIEMNVAQQHGISSNIERIGYQILDTIGIEYIPQCLIGDKFCVDAFVPAYNLVIQFDGDYWHGHPQKFPNPDSRQRKRIQLDKSQDAYMYACGYSVIRFWESDLLRRPDWVKETLLDVLARL